MDTNQLEALLNESESTSLDFKREIYLFEGASEDEKSEILKDILAFANAWRRTDAYILLGVKEVKGGRSEVIGITRHFEDASLQQFINSKVQKPVSFSYSAIEFEGKQVGIIHIPIQERPVYLKQNFGKLKKNVVYVRRGSSTVESDPDEISKMGISSVSSVQAQIPLLDCDFIDIYKHKSCGKLLEIKSRVILVSEKIGDYGSPSKPFNLSTGFSGPPNSDYYRDLYKFLDYHYLLKPISLLVRNIGKVTAYSTRIVIKCDQNDIVISSKHGLPNHPKKHFDLLGPISDSVSNSNISQFKSRINIARHGGMWTVSINYENIQPKAEGWLEEQIFIGSRRTQNLMIEILIFADNLPEPIKIPLSIQFTADELNLSLDDLEQNYQEFKDLQMEIFRKRNI